MQASFGQLTDAHRLMSDYVAAYSHFGWIPEQIHCLLGQVCSNALLLQSCMLPWLY
jgi:hypothetical protein